MISSVFIVLFFISFINSLASAVLAPICTSSDNVCDITSFVPAYEDFCGNRQGSQNGSIVDLSYVSKDGVGCEGRDCLLAFGTIVTTCHVDNHTMSGAGSMELGCGTYDFVVVNSSSSSSATSATTPSQTTKPTAGSTFSGSGTRLVEVSEYLMLGLAFIFIWFL